MSLKSDAANSVDVLTVEDLDPLVDFSPDGSKFMAKLVDKKVRGTPSEAGRFARQLRINRSNDTEDTAKEVSGCCRNSGGMQIGPPFAGCGHQLTNSRDTDGLSYL